MKKTLSLLVSATLVISLLFNLISCDRRYDEEEVRAEARSLIEKSALFNEIYWGEGISYIENTSTSNGAYYEASLVSLDKYGFSTIEELKGMTEEVFSEEYCQIIFSTTLSSVSDSGELQFYARYYQKYTDEYMTEPECIMVYSLAKALIVGKTEYLFDTLEVIGSKGDLVFVKIKAKVSHDGKTQEQELKIGLIEQKDGWRLDTPTYVSYNDKKDDYNNLQNDK